MAASAIKKAEARCRITEAVARYNAQDDSAANRWTVYGQAREEFDKRRLTLREIGDLLVGLQFSLNHAVVRSRLHDIAPGVMSSVAAVMEKARPPLHQDLRDALEACCTAIEALINGPRPGVGIVVVNAFGRTAQDKARETLRRLQKEVL